MGDSQIRIQEPAATATGVRTVATRTDGSGQELQAVVIGTDGTNDVVDVAAQLTAIARETTAAAVLAELTGKLEAGQAVALDAPTVAALTAAVALDAPTIAALAGGLTNTQLRATPVPTDQAAATATTIVDGATITATRYHGLAIANTSLVNRAHVRVRNQNAAGLILDTITLNPGESTTHPANTVVASGTVYLQVAAGAVEGSVLTA